jgi:hypothetical protein
MLVYPGRLLTFYLFPGYAAISLFGGLAVLLEGTVTIFGVDVMEGGGGLAPGWHSEVDHASWASKGWIIQRLVWLGHPDSLLLIVWYL